VHNASDENQRCSIIGIERECAFGVLLGLFEMAFLIRLGRFIQLVICSDFADQRAAGAREGKKNQDCGRANPGLRPSHFIQLRLKVKVTPRFPASEKASLAEVQPAVIVTVVCLW